MRIESMQRKKLEEYYQIVVVVVLCITSVEYMLFKLKQHDFYDIDNIKNYFLLSRLIQYEQMEWSIEAFIDKIGHAAPLEIPLRCTDK